MNFDTDTQRNHKFLSKYYFCVIPYYVLHVCVCAQSCPTLCNPMDCCLPGSSVHGILQARILEWIAISFSGVLPDPGIKSRSLASLALAGGFFSTSMAWEALYYVLFS